MKVSRKEPVENPLFIPQPVPGISPGKGPSPAGDVRQGKPGQKTAPAISFGEVLQTEIGRPGGLKISAHAERRMMERNVSLSREDMQKIESAVQRAATKGSRESLVIYGDLALVASIKNRTIITAMNGRDMEDHVFTNIDSAVIVR